VRRGVNLLDERVSGAIDYATRRYSAQGCTHRMGNTVVRLSL